MTRFVSSANESAAALPAVSLRIMVDLDFASGHVRAHDGAGPLMFGGNTYSGVGQFGGIKMVKEELALIATPVDLTISGVDPSLVASAMTEHYQGRAATIYLGLVNQDTQALIDTPEIAWDGRMDYMEIALDQRAASITVHCEHRLLREPNYARNTDEDLQQRYSGDRFFKLLSAISGFRSQWGKFASQYTSGDTYVRTRGGPRPFHWGE